MDTKRILTELTAERDRIDRAIAALKALDAPAVSVVRRLGNTTNAAPRRRRRISAAGRKRLSEMMKKRWAERKKKAKSA